MINCVLNFNGNELDDMYTSILKDKIYRYLDLKCSFALDVEEFNNTAEHLHIWLCYECAMSEIPINLAKNTMDYLDVILANFREKKGF